MTLFTKTENIRLIKTTMEYIKNDFDKILKELEKQDNKTLEEIDYKLFGIQANEIYEIFKLMGYYKEEEE